MSSTDVTRRTVLGATAAAAGAAALGAGGAVLDAANAKAPSGHLHHDLRDIKHIVVMMQENRSFDHYFGLYRGARGFGDRTALTRADGSSVFEQPNGSGTQYPYAMYDGAAENLGQVEKAVQCAQSLDHSWDGQHEAWNRGLMDGWVSAKTVLTMGYMRPDDIPFQWALAEAYTLGDAHHSSILTATQPNRTMLWSGFIDPGGKYGTPAKENPQCVNLGWTTYADELVAAGVSCRVYQASDNYDDNGLQYFKHIAGAAATSKIGKAANTYVAETGANNAEYLANAVKADVLAGTLPQVSWVVTNQVFSEHPDGPPDNGAHAVHLVMQALHADPDVWDSTLLILDYDENDGLFDHVPPPSAPPGTPGEFLGGEACGFGFRVPLVLVSPWTRGGKIFSDPAEHTSVLQFLEKWTHAIGRPARCSLISEWRRSVSSDLMTAFDFDHPVFGFPELPDTASLVETGCELIGIPGEGVGLPTTINPLPLTNEMPVQVAGTRRARPVPRQPSVYVGSVSDAAVTLRVANGGPYAHKAAHLAIYHTGTDTVPVQHTVEPTATHRTRPFKVATGGAYDLTVLGPNRFHCRFTGDPAKAGAHAEVSLSPAGRNGRPALTLTFHNRSAKPVTFTVTKEHYGHGQHRVTVPARSTRRWSYDALEHAHGWYDLAVTVAGDTTWLRRFSGHLENGRESVTG